MSDHLTTDLLVNELKEVTEWQSLGLNLGFSMAAIKEIEQDYQDMARRRMETLDRWLRTETNPSWVMVIEALEKMSELRLANKLREKYCTQQQITRSDLEPANSQAAGRVLKVDRREEVAQEIEGLGEAYLRLVTSTEASLEDTKPSPKEIKRFSQCYLGHAVTTVDELFDQLNPFYFLDYVILEKIISFFLKHDQSVVGKLRDYIQQLEEFKSSTTLKQFMESIETAQQPLTIASETSRTCTVTLKLVGGWLEKTITDLDKLLKVLFQDKSSVLTHLKIVRGSVIITYLAPRSEADSLIVIALSRNFSFMKKVGVCALQIGDTLVTNTQSELTSDFSFESSFIDAVINDNIDILSFLLDTNTSPDAADDDGYTALIWGSHFARKKVVRLLLKANATINVQAKNGITPLYAASSKGHSDVVSTLLRANADPDFQANDGATPLIKASHNGHFNVVSLLLKNNADHNHQADDGGTPLYAASYRGHTKIVSLLLKANAEPNIQDKSGRTPLYAASRNGHDDVVHLLLKANANPNLKADNGITPLYAASSKGHSDVVSTLLKANADPNLQSIESATPLLIASQNGHFNVVSLLLKNNADHNHQADDGGTPLYTASYRGHTKIVNLLLKAIAEPNIQDKSGRTPLYAASRNGHDDVVDLLLKANANPNLQAENGMTPLYAASCCGHSDTVSMLLKANADPNIQGNDGATPLFTASTKGHTKIVDLLLKANAEPNLQDKQDRTPLYGASLYGHDDVVYLLLKANANPNLQAEKGITALYATSCREHLLQHSTGYTALMCACKIGCLESVELLLTYGADPSLQTPDGLTAVDVAASKGHEDIVDLIHAVEISRSASISSAPALTANEIAANVDNEALNILDKAMEKIHVEKTESFISAQYKELDKTLPSKVDNLREYLFNV